MLKNKRIRNMLSLTLFLLGIVLMIVTHPNITGAITGINDVSPEANTFIGLILIFGALMVFSTEIETEIDEDLEERLATHKIKTIQGYSKRPLKWIEEYSILKDELAGWLKENDELINPKTRDVKKIINKVALTYFNVHRPTGEKENYKNILDLAKDHIYLTNNVSNENKAKIAEKELIISRNKNVNLECLAAAFPEWHNGKVIPSTMKDTLKEIDIDGVNYFATLDHKHEGKSSHHLELYKQENGSLVNFGTYLGNGRINEFSKKKKNSRGKYR